VQVEAAIDADAVEALVLDAFANVVAKHQQRSKLAVEERCGCVRMQLLPPAMGVSQVYSISCLGGTQGLDRPGGHRCDAGS
jgi:hypothetical protein